jgi:uncharacterized membrane protein YecN with MAPEG domain
MIPVIVPAYAAALTLIYIFLAIRVVRARQGARVAIGTGGNPGLARAIRVHGNFAEYVPLALLLLAFLEMQRGPVWLIQALCLCLVAARLVHAYGVSQEKENFRFRTVAVVATFFVLATASLALLGGAMRAAG